MNSEPPMLGPAPSNDGAHDHVNPVNPVENQALPSPLSPLPSPELPHRHRNGKVARLPKVIRDEVNQMLLDGLPFAKILETMGDKCQGVTEANVGNWKAGGFLDWLKEQRLLEECRIRQELTLDFAREDSSIDAFAAAHKITVGLLCEAVAEFGPAALRDAFKLNPLNLIRALNCLSRLTNGGLRCHQRVAEDQDRQSQLVKAEQPRPKKGLSTKTRDEMIDSLNLM